MSTEPQDSINVLKKELRRAHADVEHERSVSREIFSKQKHDGEEHNIQYAKDKTKIQRLEHEKERATRELSRKLDQLKEAPQRELDRLDLEHKKAMADAKVTTLNDGDRQGYLHGKGEALDGLLESHVVCNMVSEARTQADELARAEAVNEFKMSDVYRQELHDALLEGYFRSVKVHTKLTAMCNFVWGLVEQLKERDPRLVDQFLERSLNDVETPGSYALWRARQDPEDL